VLIDWFTVGAEALNFLILVFLMKRFLYKPILAAIDGREKKVAAELADAAAKKAEAKKERDEFREKNDQFDEHRAARLGKVTHEVNAERSKLLAAAGKAADALTAKRQDSLRRDARALSHEITLSAQNEVFAIARKTLKDLAATSLEERMTDVFATRLRALDGEAKTALAGVLAAAKHPVLVRTAFALPAAGCATIQTALNDAFAADIHLRFETAPELVSGIELIAHGQKVGWSIADYLTSLQTDVAALLKEHEKGATKAAPAPKSKAAPKAKKTSATKRKTGTATAHATAKSGAQAE
jgi:F-type H+-transporting ATPase subunit b